jgi:hypothetical protein
MVIIARSSLMPVARRRCCSFPFRMDGAIAPPRADTIARARRITLMAPLLRPVFAWNHHGVMPAVGEGLAWRLGTRLLAAGPATR